LPKWIGFWACLFTLVTVLISFVLGYEPSWAGETLGTAFVMPAAGLVHTSPETAGRSFAYFVLPLWVVLFLAAMPVGYLLLRRRGSRATTAESLCQLQKPCRPPESVHADSHVPKAMEHTFAVTSANRGHPLVLRIVVVGCIITTLLWAISYVWTFSHSGPGIRSNTFFRLTLQNGVIRYMERAYPFASSERWDMQPCQAWRKLLTAGPPSPQPKPTKARTFLTGVGTRLLPLFAIVLLTASLFWMDRRRWPTGCCQECGYDLRGNTSGRCPECGCPVKEQQGDRSESPAERLRQARLRWKVALLGAVLLAIWAACIPWTVRRAVIDYILASDYAMLEFRYHEAMGDVSSALAETPPNLELARKFLDKAYFFWGMTPEISKATLMIEHLETSAAWVSRGDDAVREERWQVAVRAYEEAQRLSPSQEIEQKARMAQARNLLNDARRSLSSGDLSDAESLLQRSMWNVETEEARSLLKQVQQDVTRDSTIRDP
jgi:hypothetical protein